MFSVGAQFEDEMKLRLVELAEALDVCFDVANAYYLWQVMNNVDDDSASMRNAIVSFFSRDYGEETGHLVAGVLLGPPEADQGRS